MFSTFLCKMQGYFLFHDELPLRHNRNSGGPSFLGIAARRGVFIAQERGVCIVGTTEMAVSQNQGCLFGASYNKDYSIWGSILGSPYFGKLPYGVSFLEAPFS